jgi:hypothetical protein
VSTIDDARLKAIYLKTRKKKKVGVSEISKATESTSSNDATHKKKSRGKQVNTAHKNTDKWKKSNHFHKYGHSKDEYWRLHPKLIPQKQQGKKFLKTTELFRDMSDPKEIRELLEANMKIHRVSQKTKNTNREKLATR